MLGGQTEDIPLKMRREPIAETETPNFNVVKPKIIDTVPEQLKSFFFSNRKPPEILQEYDCIGFDADHCVIKYKTKEMLDTLILGSLDALVNDYKGYPKELRDFDWKNRNMWMNATLWDVEKGILLKLGK